MTIDSVWMKRIKEIVNYGLNAGLCVIINEHWDGGWMEHDAFTSGVNVTEYKEMFRKHTCEALVALLKGIYG